MASTPFSPSRMSGARAPCFGRRARASRSRPAADRHERAGGELVGARQRVRLDRGLGDSSRAPVPRSPRTPRHPGMVRRAPLVGFTQPQTPRPPPRVHGVRRPHRDSHRGRATSLPTSQRHGWTRSSSCTCASLIARESAQLIYIAATRRAADGSRAPVTGSASTPPAGHSGSSCSGPSKPKRSSRSSAPGLRPRLQLNGATRLLLLAVEAAAGGHLGTWRVALSGGSAHSLVALRTGLGLKAVHIVLAVCSIGFLLSGCVACSRDLLLPGGVGSSSAIRAIARAVNQGPAKG